MSSAPRLEVHAVPLHAIRGLREEYRAEMACQIVRDSWHERGFTTSYLLRIDGEPAGYGSVGGAPRDPPTTIVEFFLLLRYRGSAQQAFQQLIEASGARRVECQTNDALLLMMLFDCAGQVTSETVLFADGLDTHLSPPGAVFRALAEEERSGAFEHTHEPVGTHGIELEGTIVATGGLSLGYNPPYADLYMEVAAPFQRRGIGSFLIQELKRVCYAIGRVPAARCQRTNLASRATLQRAGMFPNARIAVGVIGEPAEG